MKFLKNILLISILIIFLANIVFASCSENSDCSWNGCSCTSENITCSLNYSHKECTCSNNICSIDYNAIINNALLNTQKYHRKSYVSIGCPKLNYYSLSNQHIDYINQSTYAFIDQNTILSVLAFKNIDNLNNFLNNHNNNNNFDSDKSLQKELFFEVGGKHFDSCIGFDYLYEECNKPNNCEFISSKIIIVNNSKSLCEQGESINCSFYSTELRKLNYIKNECETNLSYYYEKCNFECDLFLELKEVCEEQNIDSSKLLNEFSLKLSKLDDLDVARRNFIDDDLSLEFLYLEFQSQKLEKTFIKQILSKLFGESKQDIKLKEESIEHINSLIFYTDNDFAKHNLEELKKRFE